jgi:hypothetical protein
MADSPETNATLDADPAVQDSKPTSDSATPNAGASAKAAPDAASAQAASPPDDDLQALIEKVKTTITNSLEEKDFDKQLRKHIKKIKGWQDWSDYAKSAYAHMWAAQLLHNKAVDIKKASEMDFTPVTGDSYKKLYRSLTHRVRF